MHPNTQIDGYQLLANAIIEQAVEDYRMLLIALNFNYANVRAMIAKQAIEEFFRSEWICLLSNAEAEYLLQKLEEECEEMG